VVTPDDALGPRFHSELLPQSGTMLRPAPMARLMAMMNTLRREKPSRARTCQVNEAKVEHMVRRSESPRAQHGRTAETLANRHATGRDTERVALTQAGKREDVHDI